MAGRLGPSRPVLGSILMMAAVGLTLLTVGVIDSLGLLEMISAMEDRFGVQIDYEAVCDGKPLAVDIEKTLIALGVPSIFGGAIITEQIFQVNGLGQLLITAIKAGDMPMVLTVTFMIAVLIVLFNLVADLLYGLLDPRIRYA